MLFKLVDEQLQVKRHGKLKAVFTMSPMKLAVCDCDYLGLCGSMVMKRKNSGGVLL